MASDLSSECTETIGVLDEKEEGEISLEDVSSSEEGHLNYGYGTRISHCSNCLSTQHNASTCPAGSKVHPSKCSSKRDAVQGKENRRQVKEPACLGAKHPTSTLQEKNDDLVPISSDSDMEIVGLADNSKQIIINSCLKSRVKKKRKKKRNHTVLTMDDLVSPSTVDPSMTEFVNTIKHDTMKTSVRSYHRETSPVHRARSRELRRSPTIRRRRSLVRPRSPFKRSKSPTTRMRSPRRLKSPKRSPYRSSAKPLSRKASHLELMPSHNYGNTHKLLKKVRELDSMGSHSLEETLCKNKEHASSLKEKLMHMMKGVSVSNYDANVLKEKPPIQLNKRESIDADDEEDLALLRQKALETKQNKPNKQSDQPKIEKQLSANINDDQDEEDLELRMIALRSAVIKKHQNRVRRGIRSAKYKKSSTSRSESPFTQSFLDSIPIPGEELLNFASPPHTPLLRNENNHTEDMDLDTDVEREKEKLPYSPTDKITASISMDTELLGIQPSDVSFISLMEANSSPNFTTSAASSQDDQTLFHGRIIQNRTYLPNIAYYSSNQLCPANTDISKSNFVEVHNSHANTQQYASACNTPTDNNNASECTQFLDANTNQEMPYSPTDTPIDDPDFSHALSQPSGALTTSNSSLMSLESYVPNIYGNAGKPPIVQHVPTTREKTPRQSDEQLNRAETLSSVPVVGSAATSIMDTVSPCSSMITIDDLHETNTDATAFADPVINAKSSEYFSTNVANSRTLKEITLEPLYMKGVPDVIKETNKIPTLINRTLVPVPILKTNKQLQLPLPAKKCATQPEPTFKSAEMQTVVINEETSTKINASFKPIKLTSILQKSHSVLVIPTAFHDSLQEDAGDQVSTDKSSAPSVENNPDAASVQNNTSMRSSEIPSDTMSLTQKRKKLKKGTKRKSTEVCSLSETNHTQSLHSADEQPCKASNVACTTEEQSIEAVNQETGIKDRAPSFVLEREKNDIPSKINQSEDQKGDTACNNTSEQVQRVRNRRQSLDEDEEALRAILLASLPKRAKITNSSLQPDSNTSAISATNCEPSLLNTPAGTGVLTQVSARQTPSRSVSAATGTISTASADGSTLSPSTQINDRASESDKIQHDAEKMRGSITENSSSSVKATAALCPAEKKKSIPVARTLQKKLIKRISIPASTKVVNNAKKYQNAMVQRKLNLQKATLCNKQKIAESKVIPKVQAYDMNRSNGTKTLPDTTQRIVINLDSDTESDSEPERQNNSSAFSANPTMLEKHRSTSTNPSTDFEKNLDQFLRAVRKKQESMAAARPTTLSQTSKMDTALPPRTDKNSSNLHTPLAVRHLPASQQEEYRRLKQQILEREKLKLHRTLENSGFMKNKMPTGGSPKNNLPSSPNTEESHGKVNQPVRSKNLGVQQLNKENFSKNLVDSVKNPSPSTANVMHSANKVQVAERQGDASPNPAVAAPRPMMNLNIRVSTENNTKTGGERTVGIGVPSDNIARRISVGSMHGLQAKPNIPAGLKILSTDEVNRKYVRVQVKNNTNERVVTINDKVSLSHRKSISNEGVSQDARSSDRKSICDHGVNQIVQSVDKDIVVAGRPLAGNDETVDSDASTIILPRENQIIGKEEGFDTSESTIRFSQEQEDSRMALVSSMESKDDSHFLLFNANASPNSTRSIEENWEVIRKDVKSELGTLISLSRTEQEQRLTETEEKLVTKRYTILDDLAEMSTSLRQWHMERDLQTNLAAEVKKLREQLKVAEERLQVQRNRINSIGPKVVAAHGKINAGRKECFKLATICSTLGSRVVGKEYKVPEAGAQLLDSRLKEVANHTRQLSRKKVPSIDVPEMQDLSKFADETATTVSTEISQAEDLLSEDNIAKVILKEDESLVKSCKPEATVQVDVTSDNCRGTSLEENVAPSNSGLSSDERIRSEEADNAKQVAVLAEEIESSDPPTVATTGALNSTETQGNEEASDSNTANSATLEPQKDKRSTSRSEGTAVNTRTLLPYESILTHFRVSRNTHPNGVLCPYELMGTCSDGDCRFVHQTESQAK